MDEVKKQKVAKLIKSMVSEGASSREIQDTLRTLGLPEATVQELMATASIQPTVKDVHEKVSEMHKVVTTGEHLKPVIESFSKQEQGIEELKQKTQEVHGDVSEHLEKINSIAKQLEEQHNKVKEIASGVSSISKKHEAMAGKVSEITFLRNEVREVKEMLIELKPMIAALADLNEKMLELNKKVLMRLK